MTDLVNKSDIFLRHLISYRYVTVDRSSARKASVDAMQTRGCCASLIELCALSARPCLRVGARYVYAAPVAMLVLGHFADRHFADGHFADRKLNVNYCVIGYTTVSHLIGQHSKM